MMNKDAILSELEAVREKMLDMVNNKIDALIIRIANGEPINCDSLPDVKTLYPLSITPALFKGTKPTAVYLGNERIEVNTWRKVYTMILQRRAGVSEKRDMLVSLCSKISGRSRVILSDKPDGMDCPIQITDGVFVEGFFDTEWLIRVLTTEILDAVRFDYSDISVSVVKSKRGGSRI